MTEMSITQALAELKLLRKRFEHVLQDAEFITTKTKRHPVDVETFAKDAKSSYQSYTDLLQRYNKLKSRIVISNANTSVVIAGKTYTVAEAVERKRSLIHEQQLLNVMYNQKTEAQHTFRKHQEQEMERIDKLLTTELGKDTKTSVDTVKNLAETLLAGNKAELIDPLVIDTKIRELKRSIEDFETNVDWVLSESNGKTMITM
jgi:hypothetical protein